MDYENSKNLFQQKANAIQKWQKLAIEDIDETPEIICISKGIRKTGIKNADSIHLACALYAECDYFISVDKRLKKYLSKEMVICDPIEFLRVWEAMDNE